jgi:hypothetical protein
MGTTWMTKYGRRRVRYEPPTLEEALVAAEGLTSDVEQQLQIAADLMEMPLEQVQAEGRRMIAARLRRIEVAPDRRTGAARAPVVVERKISRRIAAKPTGRLASA